MVPSDELAKVLHYYGLLEDENEYKIVCPLHEDINASLKINLNEGSFYCFGCLKTGDALRFVIELEKALYKADELLSCLKYFRILRSNKVRAIKIERKAKVRTDNNEALAIAWDYYFGLKKQDWYSMHSEIKSYIRQRGFTSDTLNKCSAKESYSKHYPIIFPMFDMGKFKGWVCRTNNKIIERKRKYLYNEGFSRSNTLVGKYDNKIVMVVEGYLDWLRMKQLGVKYVCAILGWKATEEQIKKLIKAGVKTIISALDNDKCGIKGSLHLSKYFDIIRFEFPEGVKDPGELNKKLFKVAKKKIQKEIGRIRNGRVSGRNEASNKKSRNE